MINKINRFRTKIANQLKNFRIKIAKKINNRKIKIANHLNNFRTKQLIVSICITGIWIVILIIFKIDLWKIESNDLMNFTGILLAVITPLFITQLDSTNELRDLDTQVILDRVLDFKILLPDIVLSFLVALAVEKQFQFKLLYFTGWTFFNSFIILKLFEVYTWIKGSNSIEDPKWAKNSKNKMRIDYLKMIKNKDDLELTFNSIWKVDTKIAGLEKEFINVFIEKINYLINKKDFETTANLLTDFRDNLVNRDDYGLLLNYMPKALDILVKLLKTSESQLNNQNVDLIFKNHVSTIIWETVINIEKLSIQKNIIHFFYHSLKNFTDRLEKDEIGIIENLYNQICKTLFDEITTKEITDDIVFSGFPKEWKIIIDTIKPLSSFNDEPKNIFPFIWFQNFYDWVRFRVHEKNQTLLDQQAELISDNLFPDIYKSILSNFLIVLFSYGKGDPAKWIIETQWGFGKFKVSVAFRPISSDRATAEAIIELEYENLKQKTYSLIISLIENRWCRLSKESIIKLLEQLKTIFENLKFEEKTVEQATRLEYLEIINELLKRLKGEN